jgi:hypothetical protein
VGNPGPGWDRHVNVERINQSNESHPFPLNNWMSNDYAYIYLYVNVSEILQEREGHDIENILQLLKMRKLHWSRKTYRKLRDLVNLIRRKRVDLSWYNYKALKQK